MGLNGAQACAGVPKRKLVFHTDFVPNHYTTAVSPGQGVCGALKCIFVLGAVICQTDRAYDEPLNIPLRDTQVLPINRRRPRVVIGLLTGQHTLRRHLHIMAL
jgi:hypothetical protein